MCSVRNEHDEHLAEYGRDDAERRIHVYITLTSNSCTADVAGHFLAQRCKRTAIEIFQTHALPQIPLLHFPPLHYRAEFSTPACSTPCNYRADISTPAFSSPAILTVPIFPLPHFQRPPRNN